jgi:hypothetical protein
MMPQRAALENEMEGFLSQAQDGLHGQNSRASLEKQFKKGLRRNTPVTIIV